MSSSVLTGGQSSLRYGIFTFRTLCNTQIVRSASLNSAIGRGLRRSKGVGFRGKEKNEERFGGRGVGRENERNEERFGERTGLRDRDRESVRRTSNFRPDPIPSRPGKDGRGSSRGEEYNPRRRETPRTSDAKSFRRKESAGDDENEPPTRSRAARFHDPDSRVGKGSRFKPTSDKPTSRGSKLREERRAAGSDVPRNTDGSKLSASRLSYLERNNNSRARYGVDDNKVNSYPRGSYGETSDSRPSRSRYTSKDDYERSDVGDRQSRGAQDYTRKKGGFSDNEREHFSKTGNKSSFARGSNHREQSNDERPIFNTNADKRIPLSIPYTTPASEFLYGTSVVETALNSKKDPRRKLYKLYIYAGDNRENAARDSSIERLAKKAGVEVVHVNTDWIRLMDKMSGGRPHNGYILEASPLPKVPVLSLGPTASDGIRHGFSIALDYQSREEAAVNGTSTFVSIPRDPSGRKPFVLLLDSILDPGNLGGIIRTASFLGVNAIAISTRNSASFTPVVLKASAGASEQVTLFTVKGPAGFLESSKYAGWKIYAAVAPTPVRKPIISRSVTTDKLGNPLLEDPCILVLGNEGEGLRWNLRSKADRDLSIPGDAHKGGIDSLNVSVAAGILCDAFLRNRAESGNLLTPLEEALRPKRDLF